MKARFITVVYKVQGYNSHPWCLGLRFKSESNKYESLELCSCSGKKLKWCKVLLFYKFAEWTFLYGSSRHEVWSHQKSVPFLSNIFFMSLYPSSEVWSKILFTCVVGHVSLLQNPQLLGFGSTSQMGWLLVPAGLEAITPHSSSLTFCFTPLAWSLPPQLGTTDAALALSSQAAKSGADFQWNSWPDISVLSTHEWAWILKILKAWQFPAWCFQKPATHPWCAPPHASLHVPWNVGWDLQLRVAQTLFASQEKQILEGRDGTEWKNLNPAFSLQGATLWKAAREPTHASHSVSS